MISTDIVDRIFVLAEKKFIEQRDFATALGVPQSVISAWRTRKSNSYNKRLSMVADILNTNVDYLINGEKKEPTTVSDDGPPAEILELLKRVPADRWPEVERYLRFQADQEGSS